MMPEGVDECASPNVGILLLRLGLRQSAVEETIGRILYKELLGSLYVVHHCSLFRNARIKF